jgi:hypothetical protein
MGRLPNTRSQLAPEVGESVNFSAPPTKPMESPKGRAKGGRK